MLQYILRRVFMMIPTLFAISLLSFLIIQLPPGDFLTSYAAQLREMGDSVDVAELEALRQRYGLDQPFYVQYSKWISGILLRGDWGQSLEWRKPVRDLIWERLALTVVISGTALLVSWLVAIPIGVYSATRQYSFLDYAMTAFSFVGLGTPGFLLALVVMFMAQSYFGMNVGGLFSEEYMLAPWNWAKVVDMLKHLWMPLIIVSLGSIAGNIRITRANLLDELNKPYVETARAKGMKEGNLIWKYPVRVALNPFFSTVGWSLATLISGTTLVSIVLSLQTTGPMLLRALTSQDMYLAGSFIYF
jgi:peptide/nickel transport system permease protein